MSVRIRLTRVGRNKTARYRVVVTTRKEKRDGRIIELLGHYDPMAKPKVFSVKRDRVDYWLSKGALATSTVAKLLKPATK